MKSNYLLIVAILICNSIFSQEESKSKWDVIGFGGIGYGILENESEPNYNMNINSSEILLNYRISEEFGIASGIGLNIATGNGFSSLGEFYHERNLLKIPLLITLNGEVSKNIEYFGHFGFYTQNIIKDNYEFLSNSVGNIYKGWSFGGQLGIGVLFDYIKRTKFGFTFNSQSDFSKFRSNNAIIASKQKMKSMNTIGLLLKYEL